MWHRGGLVLVLCVASACTPRDAHRPPGPDGEDATALLARRPFPPSRAGRPLLHGIAYGPYREGQWPGGPEPTETQLRDDLHLLAERWEMVRLYGSRGPSPRILRILRDDRLPLAVVLGAWLGRDAEDNAAEARAAIDLARAYPDLVVAVSVGNETQVPASVHRLSRTQLIAYVRAVRGAVAQPVTTADDHSFWRKPESHDVAAEIDFLMVHAYAMWSGEHLSGAVAWTGETVDAVRAEHPALPVVLGETGWATELNPEGEEVEHIDAPAGEAAQAVFFEAFTAWARTQRQPSFYFEAFDEPWKGTDDPRDVEKHWGLYRANRQPKAAMQGDP